MLPMILGVVVQYVDGNQRIICVNELCSDYEEFITSGEDDNSLTCCVYGNYSCSSLDHALDNLTSNVLINITTDVTLSSLVTVSHLENVSIIGHNNPTVNCNSAGGINITFCNNCIIQGITWDRCGTENISNDTEPGLKLSYSSNVTIQSCFFQQSVGQAVVLSEMLGDVSINNCMFMNNSHYRGHGAAVHYSSSTNNTINYSLTIKNCNFSYNNIKSLVYLENKGNKIILNNSTFNYNQGISVYATNQKMYLNGKVLLENNTAENGVGIYISDHSSVTCVNNSEVTFIQNSAKYKGGAVFLRNHSSIIFDQNSVVSFINNGATNGIVYSDAWSDVKFKGNCNVIFSGNSATQWGAAIYSDNSLVTFTGNSNVTFSSNYVSTDDERSFYHDHPHDHKHNNYGGIIYSINFSNISFEGSSTTLFNNNTAYNGGAIFSSDYSSISFEGNSNTIFSNNYVAYEGGLGNASTMFTIYVVGGAITSDEHANIFFGGNSVTTFIDNNSKYGGAIFCYNSNILHEENSTTIFNNNAADYLGGAIFCYNSNILHERNSTTMFNNNAADYGGAIHSYFSNITFEGISTVVFSDNMANHDGGGAVFLVGNVSFNGNSNTEFRDNTANENGGAMLLHANLTFNNNSNVNFTSNKAKSGATIFSSGESNKIMEIGNPTIRFNDHIVIWCTNPCLSNDDSNHSIIPSYRFGIEIDVITIDSNGTIRCSDEQKAFVSLNRKCGFKYLEDILVNLTTNGLATISGEVIIFSVISLTKLYNVSIIGSKNHSITCVNNYNAGLQVKDCSNITIEGLNWTECGADTTPVINILNSSDVTLQDCLFQQSKGPAVVMFQLSGYVSINHCQFINNTEYSGHGAAVHHSSNDATNSQLTLVISNCNFTHNEGAISLVHINGQTENTNISLCNSSFHNNHGISVYLSNNTLHINGEVLFKNNEAKNGAGIYINKFSEVTFDDFSNVKFINNFVNHSGAAVFLNDHSSVLFDQNSIVTFTGNKATNGTVYSEASSNVIFKATCNVAFSGNLAIQYGAAIYSSNNSHVTFTGNSNVMFNNNAPGQFINYGGTVYCEHSSVIFQDNSTVAFHNNTGYNGGAILSQCNSVIIFEDNTIVMFNNNKAHNSGGTLFADSGSVTIKDNSTVTFNNNKATQYGGAVYYEHHQSMFGGNSIITFIGNEATGGGAIYANSIILFLEFAKVTFKNNTANQNGGAIYCEQSQTFLLGGNSTTTFSDNKARDGGAVHALSMCKIIFTENSSSTFSNNVAINHGGAIVSVSTDISFMGTSTIAFNNNIAGNGGTFYLTNFTTLTFNDDAVITFHNNLARQNGGVLYSINALVLFNGNSIVSLSQNEAMLDGAVMYCDTNCNISILEFTNINFNKNRAVNGGVFFANYSTISLKGHIIVTFTENEAKSNGGVGYFSTHCIITLEENANVTFENNNALNGGLLYSINSTLLFKGNSTVSLAHNKAVQDGGAMHCGINSTVLFLEFTNISFINNKAINGGVIFANNNSIISFEGHASGTFIKNEARNNGGAGYFSMHCIVTINEYVNVIFDNNNALYGGALCINYNTSVTFGDNSTSLFKNNLAANDGGAINILRNSSIMLNNNAKINFTANNAQYGGAMFFDTTHTTLAFTNNEFEGNTSFISNTARIAGDYMYFDSTGSTGSCLQDRIICINNKTKQFIATPPSKLEFFAPATCISYDNRTAECNTYHLKHIMLGEEINVPVCVLNYCNQPSYSIPFLLHGVNKQNYTISGSKRVLISGNDTFQGISIIGNNRLSKPSNYTINFILHDDRNFDWKQVSVNLTVELTPCHHPGFWQNSGSEKCECYNANNIVFCSGSNSTIKRGYWFGSVTGKPTVTFCPINYCNFTCCEASNGYYHLSPVRDNQCRSHRSGTACGNCTDGYTLSFDSPECVNVDSCTAGQTVLVILLTVTYWIIMVTLVFAIMYYKVPIGYLYSITYYYSIVDILLSENLQTSKGLYLTVSIMSSFSKITPQFLGELCLATGMSGIDQYFIHYIHPTAVILILAIIILSARSSIRISAFISRGIIHVICLLLLLSYTSIASTSLLLMRLLKFHGIDKMYTYLSPDIEYFHGRHLAYGIVALICTITIVLGLPLLLILEPVLNHKINFAKIKPLLDQFQGCYKDKFRCFASYYMICRLVIITIVIANSSDELVAKYLLIVVCGVITLIHITARPYNNEIVNKFDSMILQLIIFITALSSFDNSILATSIIFMLILLPLLTLTAITLFLHKDDIKKITKHFTFKDKASNNGSGNNVQNMKEPMKEFDLIVDESARNNATVTVCDM